jgi:glycosyltransferase involved in cell wall biosynthesis
MQQHSSRRYSKPKLSIVIPAFNEEARIQNTLADYLNWLNSRRTNFELIVIIEGYDNTCEIVRSIAKKEHRVKYLYNKMRLGKGNAIKSGFELATGEFIGFVDADESIDPKNFERLLNSISNCDGVIASRKTEGAKVLTKSSALQRLGSFGFNLLVKILLGLRFKDTQCGAKLFRADAVKSVVKNLTVNNFAFDVELLYLLAKKHYIIKEVPITWCEKAGSAFSFNKFFWKHVPVMFLSLLRIKAKHSAIR